MKKDTCPLCHYTNAGIVIDPDKVPSWMLCHPCYCKRKVTANAEEERQKNIYTCKFMLAHTEDLYTFLNKKDIDTIKTSLIYSLNNKVKK